MLRFGSFWELHLASALLSGAGGDPNLKLQSSGHFSRTISSQLTQSEATAFAYDLNGNLTSDGTNGYTWDARNRLVSTLSGASFRYDPFRRRVSKTVGGATTNYLYKGANVAQELSGATPTANRPAVEVLRSINGTQRARD